MLILMFNKFCSNFSLKGFSSISRNHGLSLKFNLLDFARDKAVLFGNILDEFLFIPSSACFYFHLQVLFVC